MAKIVKICNNCGRPVVYDHEECMFFHSGKEVYCDKTHTKAVDITDKLAFNLQKAGFTRLASTKEGKMIRLNPTTTEEIYIDMKGMPTKCEHNTEIFTKYGILAS